MYLYGYKGGLNMKKHTKGFLSAVISAALCTASIPVQTVNADIVIDHDCSGIDKSYYYEIANNDKDSQPNFLIQPGGCFRCEWDNEEGFRTGRGLKFASPVSYKELGNITYKYWKRIDTEGYTDSKNGYVRLGVRLHNSKGDVIDILEVEDSADGRSIVEKDENYKEIGKLCSEEVFHDTLFGLIDVKGDAYAVDYTLYSRENGDENGNTFIFRRDVPMTINNDIEDDRRINITDKLNALAATGYDIGEITDIGLFLESDGSKGSAYVYTVDVSIENMPELAPDEYEDEEAAVTLKDIDYGVRTGYYYHIEGRGEKDQMVLIAPSQFSAEWDARDNSYNNDPIFERGKQYEPGQSYKAISGSSIEYTMDFEASGSFAVSAAAKLGVIEMPEYYVYTDIYVVDACSQGWVPSKNAQNLGKLTVDGVDYDVYDGSQSWMGTGKSQLKQRYYFISRDAAENGMKGTVTAKHDIAPFMEYVHNLGIVLGCADVLVAQVNGSVSVGSAELVKLDVELPEFIADEGEYERMTRKIDLNDWHNSVYLKGLHYGVNGTAMTMYGYADEKINYEWGEYQPGVFASNNAEFARSFNIGLCEIQRENYEYGCESNESLLFDYNIDIGDISSDKEGSEWALGGFINCINEEYLHSMGEADCYFGCYILIADKWEGELTSELVYGSFRDPEKLGVIESGGVKYDVIAYIPEVRKDNLPFVIVKRQKQLEAVEADDVSDGCIRYEGSFDAADIARKVSGLGIDTYDIQDVYFTLKIFKNTGSAVVNSVSAKRTENDIAVYTADDIRNFKSFLLGEKIEIPTGADYDVNGDGIWDIHDLCVMRSRIAPTELN